MDGDAKLRKEVIVMLDAFNLKEARKAYLEEIERADHISSPSP